MPVFSFPHCEVSRGLWLASACSLLIHAIALASFSRSWGSELNFETALYDKSFTIPQTKSIQATIITKNITRLETQTGTTPPLENIPALSGSSNSSVATAFPPNNAGDTVAKSSKSGSRTIPNVPYHFPSYLLDRAPVPISAPNPAEHLMHSAVSISPIRLRLYIDATGKVTDIDTLSPDVQNEVLIESLRNMFFATSFIAGNRHGKDVASYIDIEVGLSVAER